MSRGEQIFDWILKRKRCPFCVAPFPVLKCVSFELWQCPKCETEFCLDDENDLEPIFNEIYYKNDGIKSHFPKSSSTNNFSHNILCSNCTENQQKIVQLLQSFDSNSSLNHRKQYELYANKLESRYPLCATCSYRVSVHLKKCEEEAGLEERRRTALSGGDWQNKLKLAEKMKWKQFKRKIVKGFFFWPDFLFQLYLTIRCVFRETEEIQTTEINYKIFGDLMVWLPSKHFNFGSFYFVICVFLFFIQFNGIALNRRSPFELVPQMFLLISRTFIGNYLHNKSSIDLNLVLALTAVGLAVIFKTKSRNSLVSYENKRNVSSTFISSETIFPSKSPLNQNILQPVRELKSKNGFSAYSENHFKFHSFANQVAPDTAKPIMPWAEKPLPGKLIESRSFNFNENLLSTNGNNNNNNSSSSYKMRPSKLISDDPLELEPMFSSFSLSDEPKTTNRRSSVRTTVKLPNNTVINNNGSTSNSNSASISISYRNSASAGNSKAFNTVITGTANNSNTNNIFTTNTLTTGNSLRLSIGIVYNSLLTLILLTFRFTLMQETSLISIILALTFGLRGFIWPRLSFKVQLATLTVAVARLAWLGAELNGKIKQRFGYVALALDLILIILR